MLNYKMQAENGSLYNTPPTFGIYILRLVLKWLVALGGLAAIGEDQRSQGQDAVRRAGPDGVLEAARRRDSRSRMNVTFRLAVRRSREAVRQGIHGRRLRRPEGPSFSRRPACVDLQRVSRGRRRARSSSSCGSSRKGTDSASYAAGGFRRRRRLRRRLPLRHRGAGTAGCPSTCPDCGGVSACACLPVLAHFPPARDSVRRVAKDLEPGQCVVERRTMGEAARDTRGQARVQETRQQVIRPDEAVRDPSSRTGSMPN